MVSDKVTMLSLWKLAMLFCFFVPFLLAVVWRKIDFLKKGACKKTKLCFILRGYRSGPCTF